MSDQRLRDFRRRWIESSAVQDEAAYLLERLRVGDLSRERLELAALCGHEGATLTLSPTMTPSDRLTPTWLCELLPAERFRLGQLIWDQGLMAAPHVAPPFAFTNLADSTAEHWFSERKEGFIATRDFGCAAAIRCLEWARALALGRYPGNLPPSPGRAVLAAWSLES